MNFFRDRKPSEAASDLVNFDADSIRQVVSAQRFAAPDVWLADSDGYEKNGRVLRDSDSPRMLAYSTKDHILYATDGCNSCARQVRMSLELLPFRELKEFAEHNGVRLEFLQALSALVSGGRGGRPLI